jgi:hypothetical protein
MAIGWTGAWRADMQYGGEFWLTIGTQDSTHFKMLPGEKFIMPYVVIYERRNKSVEDGLVEFHRFIIEHKTPRDANGKIFEPLMPVSASGGDKTDANMLKIIDFVKNGKTVDKIIKEGELTDDQLEAGMTEREAVAQGIIKRDTVWISAAEKLGITNPDSLKFVPVGRVADGSYTIVRSTFDPSLYDTIYQGVIELRKTSTFNIRTNEFDVLVEFRARLEDYMDGMNEKKVKSVKADLKKRHRNRAELMLDNEDQTDGEWYGLRIGDLEDTNNKMAGNWE